MGKTSDERGGWGCRLGLRSPRVCRAQRNVRGRRRRHTANSAWAGKQRGACCCGALQGATCTSASVCCSSRLQNVVTKHTHMAQDSSAPLRLHLHSPHAAPRHALHHPASETPRRPIARRGGHPPACRRHATEHFARWHTRKTAVAQAVEGRQRVLREALAACCRPSPPKEPRCSFHEPQRARDLRQRCLLIGRPGDVGKRHSGAGKVISE